MSDFRLSRPTQRVASAACAVIVATAIGASIDRLARSYHIQGATAAPGVVAAARPAKC